ncbi:MFS transporter [Gordonia soli]|uniref:Major facilitator superfamily transporter n=1 Tax=Gordonia soli NBRC 108243 TaxID=1223545 RepID=M0QJ40_9ACTN|nr:MFS transporter [Gordonia soli]GAC67432.1 hypothetical protein GS4_08_00160 [Gordonia soli NBRC 108243]
MSQTLTERLRSLAPIRGLLIAITASRCAVLLFPFYGAYLAQHDDAITPAYIGLIVGAFGAGALVGDLAVGWLTRLVSERNAAVAGLFGVAVAVSAIALVDNVWLLIPLTAAWGACYELVNPISNTMVSRAYRGEAARFGFAALRLAVNVGMAIGPVVAGVIYHYDPNLLPWGTAIGFAVAAVILARTNPVQALEHAAGTNGYDEMVDDRPDNRTGLAAFLVATLPIHVVYAFPSTVVSIYVVTELGYSSMWVSAVFALNAALVITCEIALNHATAGVRRKWILLAGFAFGIGGFGLMGAGVEHAWLLLVATAIWTIGEMIVYPVMTEQVTATTSARTRARGMGWYTATMNVGVIVAPIAFLPLLREIGPVPSWLSASGLLLVGMVASALISSRPGLWGADSRTDEDDRVDSERPFDVAMGTAARSSAAN